MIINDEKKFVWFQPWKVASTTTYVRLKNYDSGQLPRDRHYNPILKKKISRHIFYKDFLRLFKDKSTYTKVCFFRNPYDRFYAGFRQNIDDERSNEPRNEYGKIVKSECFKSWVNFTYNSFIENKMFFQTHSLTEYCYYENKFVIDKVGYVENFENDFKRICDELNLKFEKKDAHVKYKKALPSADPFNLKDTDYRYLDKYDSECIHAVNEIFYKDFEILKYKKIDA